MAEQNPNPVVTSESNPETAPIIPPGYLLIISAAGFILAILMLLVRREPVIEFWGGLGVGVLCLIAWAAMAPDQFMNLLRGRGLTYGGTGILATIVFIVMLVGIYLVVERLGIRADFSDTQVLTLTEEAREVITTLAADPTTPPLKIIGFFTSGQGSSRDQVQILLDDIVKAGGSKITYEFVNPDFAPLTLQAYADKDARAGTIVVVPLDASGNPVKENAEVLTSLQQQQIIDSLITASSTGTFRAFFLQVQDGVDFSSAESGGGLVLNQQLQDRYKWDNHVITLVDLLNQKAEVKLNDPAVDGEVLVIGGGSAPLPDDQLKLITDYLDAGGNLVLLAGADIKGGESLATAENLNSYLTEKFGIHINNDVVLDLNYRTNSILTFQAAVTPGDHFIVRDYTAQTPVLVDLSHSLTLTETPPADVTLTTLIGTSDSAYSKTGLDLTNQNLTEDDLKKAESDRSGVMPIAVAAENSKTGSRVVVFGTDVVAFNDFKQYESLGLVNTEITQNAILWAAGYDAYRNIPPLNIVQPQPVPLIATENQLALVNTFAAFVLPFGVLLLGIFVWWTRRERERA